MKNISFILLLLCIAAIPSKAEWVLQPRTFMGKVMPNEPKVYVWHSPPTQELPKELQRAKPLEEEGPLATLKISKKELEAEGYIQPLEVFMKVKDRGELDLKALRRSLLHLALTKAQMDEVVTHPQQLNSEGASQGEFLTHYGGSWPVRKMYQWLVHDILVIEYLNKRPEKYWKTGALIGAHNLQNMINLEDLEKLKDTGPIGFAITELYIIPYLQHAVPVACRDSMYKTSDVYIGIYGLYNKLKLTTKWYLSFFEEADALEKPYEPSHHNIRIKQLSEIYIKEGDLDKAIKALEQWDSRDDQTSPLNTDVMKKLEALKKTQTKNTITTCSIAAL